MNRLRLIVTAAVCALAAACGADGPDVPALPTLEIEHLPPAVREQLTAARERAASDPPDAAASGDLGSMLHAYGYLAAAADCYRRSTVLEPESPEWAYLLGDVLERLGRTEEAIDSLRAALRLAPADDEIALELASLLTRTGEASAAEDLYAQVLRRDPANAHALYGLGALALGVERPQDAVDYAERAIESAGDFGAAHYLLV